jgi:hypothetical protein
LAFLAGGGATTAAAASVSTVKPLLDSSLAVSTSLVPLLGSPAALQRATSSGLLQARSCTASAAAAAAVAAFTCATGSTGEEKNASGCVE